MSEEGYMAASNNRFATVVVTKDGLVISFDSDTGNRGPALQYIQVCQWGQIGFLHTEDSNYTIDEQSSNGYMKKVKTVNTPFGPMEVFQMLSQWNFYVLIHNQGFDQWVQVWLDRCLDGNSPKSNIPNSNALMQGEVKPVNALVGKLGSISQEGSLEIAWTFVRQSSKQGEISVRALQNGDFVIVVDNETGEVKQFEYSLNPGVIPVLPVQSEEEQIPDGFDLQSWNSLVNSQHTAYLICREQRA